MTNDPTRRYDGQQDIPYGMDSGNAPNAINPKQVAFACNVTFRSKFPATRPPFDGIRLTYADADTCYNFNHGVFQGAMVYSGRSGQGDAVLVARAGRQFRIDLQTLLVTEITPHTKPVLTNSTVTVPAVGASVTITLNTTDGMDVGDAFRIDSGLYTVTAIIDDSTVTVTYGGGAANATFLAGLTVYTTGGSPLLTHDTNNALDTFAYWFQAEHYGILLQGAHAPDIFDGVSSRRSRCDTAHEIPPGYVGAYVNGRIWIALPTRTAYLAGDLVGDRSSGTVDHNYIDSVLRVTSNEILNEGGAFSTLAGGGLITAIGSSVQLDTSLGNGPVAIFTTNAVFTNQAPADAATWKDLTYPIQTVAHTDYGALGARSVVNVNSDTWFRSEDGIRSFIVARRNFGTGWGNTPMSQEMGRILDADSKSLLEHGSAVIFDNRLLVTCSPVLKENGVSHNGMAVLNFDEVSGMYSKSNPAWEGVWTGLNIWQVLKGRVGGVERCFLLCEGSAGETELWEVGKDGPFDQFSQVVDGVETVYTVPIRSFIETRSFNFAGPFENKRLQFTEVYYDQIQGNVNFDLKFRRDQYPCWVDWHSWLECHDVDHCDEICGIPANYKPGYRVSVRTPNAPESCLPYTQQRANMGYEFQLRLAWTGKARVKQLRLHAKAEVDSSTGATCPVSVAMPEVDDEPPTPPVLVGVQNLNGTIGLTWSGATDNFGVVGYRVYRDDVLVFQTSLLEYTDVSVTPGSTYDYTVSAFDAMGNLSEESNEVSVTSAIVT